MHCSQLLICWCWISPTKENNLMCWPTKFSPTYPRHKNGTGQNAERSGSAGRIWMVTICGSIRPICRSVIIVGLGLEIGLGMWLGLVLGLAVGWGWSCWLLYTNCWKKCQMRINQNCGWSKLTNGDPPRSAFCRVPTKTRQLTFLYRQYVNNTYFSSLTFPVALCGSDLSPTNR